jgi:hypothetical protein
MPKKDSYRQTKRELVAALAVKGLVIDSSVQLTKFPEKLLNENFRSKITGKHSLADIAAVTALRTI